MRGPQRLIARQRKAVAYDPQHTYGERRDVQATVKPAGTKQWGRSGGAFFAARKPRGNAATGAVDPGRRKQRLRKRPTHNKLLGCFSVIYLRVATVFQFGPAVGPGWAGGDRCGKQTRFEI